MSNKSVNKPKVFISYSRKDVAEAMQLVEALDAAKMKVAIDNASLRCGEGLVQSLYANVEENDVILLLVSPNSLSSDWVLAETFFGLAKEQQTRRAQVLPITIDKASAGRMEELLPKPLLGRVVKDLSPWFRDPRAETARFERLVADIRMSVLPSPAGWLVPLAWFSSILFLVTFLLPVADWAPSNRWLVTILRALSLGTFVAGLARDVLWRFRQRSRLAATARWLSAGLGVVVVAAAFLVWPATSTPRPVVTSVVGAIDIKNKSFTVDVAYLPFTSLTAAQTLYLEISVDAEVHQWPLQNASSGRVLQQFQTDSVPPTKGRALLVVHEPNGRAVSRSMPFSFQVDS